MKINQFHHRRQTNAALGSRRDKVQSHSDLKGWSSFQIFISTFMNYYLLYLVRIGALLMRLQKEQDCKASARNATTNVLYVLLYVGYLLCSSRTMRGLFKRLVSHTTICTVTAWPCSLITVFEVFHAPKCGFQPGQWYNENGHVMISHWHSHCFRL